MLFVEDGFRQYRQYRLYRQKNIRGVENIREFLLSSNSLSKSATYILNKSGLLRNRRSRFRKKENMVARIRG